MGESKPDWEIIQLVANAMGANWNYTHPSQIMDEASVLTPLFAGVSYERLEGWKSQVWPVEPDGKGTPLLYQDEFHFPDGKAKLFPVDWTPPQTYEQKYDLHINNGRLLEHFHEGNMTYQSAAITHKVPNAWLEVSPELAAERGIKDGATVRLTSPEGAVKLRVLITDRVKGNELYLPMNTSSSNQAINFLTSSEHDLVTDTPNYKETAVAMEVLSYDGESPLPKSNHRIDTQRNPQIGVRVQDKWNRPDFVPVEEVIRREED
nr:molybdopterin dinucleotide binding domain-containing protein [Paenibacillus sp. An7]